MITTHPAANPNSLFALDDINTCLTEQGFAVVVEPNVIRASRSIAAVISGGRLDVDLGDHRETIKNAVALQARAINLNKTPSELVGPEASLVNAGGVSYRNPHEQPWFVYDIAPDAWAHIPDVTSAGGLVVPR